MWLRVCMVVQEESSCHASVFLGRLSSWGLLTPPLPPPARPQGNIQDWSGLRCSAARQNHELGMVAMTICLCHGGICELSIRCSWPLNPPPPPGRPSLGPKSTGNTTRQRRRRKIFFWLCWNWGEGGPLQSPHPPPRRPSLGDRLPPPPRPPHGKRPVHTGRQSGVCVRTRACQWLSECPPHSLTCASAAAHGTGYIGLAATTWVPMGAQVPTLSPNDHPNPSQG